MLSNEFVLQQYRNFYSNTVIRMLPSVSINHNPELRKPAKYDQRPYYHIPCTNFQAKLSALSTKPRH